MALGDEGVFPVAGAKSGDERGDIGDRQRVFGEDAVAIAVVLAVAGDDQRYFTRRDELRDARRQGGVAASGGYRREDAATAQGGDGGKACGRDVVAAVVVQGAVNVEEDGAGRVHGYLYLLKG